MIPLIHDSQYSTECRDFTDHSLTSAMAVEDAIFSLSFSCHEACNQHMVLTLGTWILNLGYATSLTAISVSLISRMYL